MHAGNGQLHPKEKSRQLQRRLYLAAKKSRNRRFHALYDRIFRPDVLWRAWEEVRANGGSAGVDGVSLEEVERQGVALFLEAIAGDLKVGRYNRSRCCAYTYPSRMVANVPWEFRPYETG